MAITPDTIPNPVCSRDHMPCAGCIASQVVRGDLAQNYNNAAVRASAMPQQFPEPKLPSQDKVDKATERRARFSPEECPR